jgi:hypothetical protein
MNFDIFYIKTLCLGKTAITFPYEVGLKSFYMKKYLHKKLHPKKFIVYCSESLTLGTHLSAMSSTFRNLNFMGGSKRTAK